MIQIYNNKIYIITPSNNLNLDEINKVIVDHIKKGYEIKFISKKEQMIEEMNQKEEGKKRLIVFEESATEKHEY